MKEKIYHVGDKVKITNLKQDKHFTFGVNSDMYKYSGTFMTITHVGINAKVPELTCYYMKEDDGMWAWSISMFETNPIKVKGFVDISVIL